MFNLKNLYFVTAAVSFIILVSACTTTPKVEEVEKVVTFPHDISDLPADPRVRYGILENGMRYAIVENDTPEKEVALRFIFNIGSLAEDEDQLEVAHFLEHMNFNGSTNVPEGEMIPMLERYGLSFGADTNAFVGPETTGYLLTLPDNSEQIINVGLFLMRETATELLFEQGAVDREEGVIIAEGMSRNQPVRRFFDAYNAYLHPGTSAARPSYPSDEFVAALTSDKFKRFYADYYVPERAILVIAGDVDADMIEQKITNGFEISIPDLEVSQVESFNTWQQPENARELDYGNFVVPEEPTFGFFYDPEIFTIIAVDIMTPGEGPVDSKQSRMQELKLQLAHSIVSRRVATDINAGKSPLIQYTPSYSNKFGAVNSANIIAVANPARLNEGIAIIEQSIRQALVHGFTQSELNEQLAIVRTAIETAANQANTRQTPALANSIYQSWTQDRVFVSPEFVLEWFNQIESTLTLQAVEDAYRKVWSGDNPSVFVTNSIDLEGKQTEIASAWKTSMAQDVIAVEDTGELQFAYSDFGEAGTVKQSNSVDDLNFTQVEFDNGVTLNVKTTDFEENRVRLRADFGYGRLTSETTPAIGQMGSNVYITGGLEAHTFDEVQRLLAGKAVNFSFNMGDDFFSISGNTTPDDLALQLQFMTAYLTAPGFREESLTRYKTIIPELRRQNSSGTTSTVTSQVFRDIRSNDTRWGLPTEEEVANLTREHVVNFFAPSVNEAPVEVTIVGDISVEQATELVAATFGALPKRNTNLTAPEANAQVNFKVTGTETVEVEFNGQADQAMANIFYQTTDSKDVGKSRLLTVTRDVLRQKAIEILREELGATYSPIVSSSSSAVFDEFGYMWFGIEVKPEDLEETYKVTNDIVKSMRAGNVTEDDLQRALQPIFGNIEQQKQSNQYWLSVLSRTQRDASRLDRIRSYRSDYESVTVEDVVAAANQYLTDDRAYRVTIRAKQN